MELKTIRREAIPAALERARHYRLLNEAPQAESICRDVLAVEPAHREARVVLLLALTDQFDERLKETFSLALELADSLDGEYERAYYTGLVCERRARAQLRRGAPGIGGAVFDWLQRALAAYERAALSSPPDNDEALLRWNACARLIDSHPEVRPAEVDTFRPLLE